MAANTVSYDNVVPGVSDPPAGKVMVLGRLYQLPQGKHLAPCDFILNINL